MGVPAPLEHIETRLNDRFATLLDRRAGATLGVHGSVGPHDGGADLGPPEIQGQD